MAWVKSGERVRNGRTTPWVRWENPDGRQHSRTFKPKGDKPPAERKAKKERDSFAADLSRDLDRGVAVDPMRGRMRFGDWAEHWQPRGRPSTVARDRSWLRSRVLPKWSDYQLAAITRSEVQSWVAELEKDLAPATVEKVLQVLRKVLAAAILDDRLVSNAVDGVERDRPADLEARFMTADELVTLEEAVSGVGGGVSLIVPFLVALASASARRRRCDGATSTSTGAR